MNMIFLIMHTRTQVQPAPTKLGILKPEGLQLLKPRVQPVGKKDMPLQP